MRGIIRTAVVAVIAVAVGWAAGAADPKQENSPHAEALALLLSKQADEIRKVEIASRSKDEVDPHGDVWWHDVKERTWIVQRPIAPGILDTTHCFEVTYRIDGKDVAKWMVDTRKGTAKLGTTNKK